MRSILFVWAVLLSSTVISAQGKIGHMNSGNIIALMPEAARADSGLVIYRNELIAKGDSVGKAFERDYKAFVEAYNAGTLSQQQAAKRQEELQKKQQALQAFAQEVDQRVANLRQQLLQPILVQLDVAIKEVGKEGGYQVILDTSNGSTLFAAEGDDVMELVKKKMGLK